MAGPKNDIAGIILAGGESRRMGRNKALLEIRGKKLIALAVEALRPFFKELVVAGGSEEDYGFLGLPVLPDRAPGEGVFRGLISGLEQVAAPRALVTGCDMPFIRPALIEFMLSRPPASIVVPRVRGHFEPLFAVYSKRCLGPGRALLEQGEKRIQPLFERVETLIIEESALRRHDPELRTFINLNRPEDLEKTNGL